MAYWSKNDGVPFSFLFRAFDFTTQRVCRNDVNVACNMLRTVMRTTPRDLLAVFHLLANKIAPKHELASDLGVGSGLIITALAEAYNKPEDEIRNHLLAALGQAAVYNENRNLEPLDSPEAAEIVKRVHSICLVYDKLIWAILDDGISKLSSSCSFSIGVPVEPMLAKLSLAESEIIERFNDGKVKIYTRNLEPSSEMFPDVVIAVSRSKKSGVKSTRRRKHVALIEIKVQFCIFAFDILYLNGDLIYEQQLVRGRIRKIEKFLKAAMDANCESLVIKGLDDAYEPSTYPWLKLKKEYMEGIGDSLDLVSIAAYHGRSSKQALTSIRNFMQIKDGIFEENSYRNIFQASFEGDSKTEALKASSLTTSPVYYAAFGVVEASEGLLTWFHSFFRVRKDKDPEQASSLGIMVEMYQKQVVKTIK
ncbi:hypothetical protein ES288_D06G245900v1 [Gossypium darwinii]|uniref:ATP-dependent DNA ligase family profile domain-containing protein n=1 Tax=Gossypium darwinii TaxID=34276 RepID=A0A5D2CBV5_GOSDA|nr:hypothetical protein ES288_D06G245900v1 [Gossypium darwinii]